MNKDIKIRVLLNFLIAAFLIAATAEYDGSRISVVETLEQQSYDWRINNPDARKQNDIVIIDIDRDTLRKYGNWPLDRDLFARLNRQLFQEKYRVKIAAYTLPFSQPDDTALNLLADIKEEFSANNIVTPAATSRSSPFASPGSFRSSDSSSSYAIQRQIDELRVRYNYDQQVIDSMQNHPIVLGYIFDASGRIEGALPAPAKFVDKQKKSIPDNYMKSLTNHWPLYTGYAGNLENYLTAVDNNAGHINFDLDKDGIIRRAPYFISHLGGYYPSLPIAVYQRLTRSNDIIAEINGGPVPFKNNIRDIVIGNRNAPTNNQGDMYIHYLGTGGRYVNFDRTREAIFRYVSFADVIEGKAPGDYLEDKIVFIGSSSSQLPYLYPTPVNSAMPGVEILATQLINLLSETILKRDNLVILQEIVLVALAAVVLSILFVVLSPLYALLILIGTLIGYTLFVMHEWSENYTYWGLTPIFITLLGLFIFSAIIGFIIEWQRSRQLQSTFGQYVPPEFAKKIGGSQKNINLEGELRELSVLFSDVRNFTTISENLSPRDLTLIMNRMLTDLSEVIHQHGGTVDKYIGDAVMAFWNAPLYNEDHAEKSVRAALDMQQAMQKLSKELAEDGFQPMRLGVGICTGNANVGNMGSKLRMTYTAVGDTVNLASRTEGLTKYYGCPILVTETTRQQCSDDIVFRVVDLVRVKGRHQDSLIYQPIGLSQLLLPGKIEQLEQFEKMRQLYTKGEFAAAQEILVAYTNEAPDDELAKLYKQRLELLLNNPPAEWDGVTTHENK